MREIGDAALPGGHRALQRRRGMGEAPQDAQHGEYEYGDADPLMPCVVLKFEWWKARDTGHHPAQGKAANNERRDQPMQSNCRRRVFFFMDSYTLYMSHKKPP